MAGLVTWKGGGEKEQEERVGVGPCFSAYPLYAWMSRNIISTWSAAPGRVNVGTGRWIWCVTD